MTKTQVSTGDRDASMSPEAQRIKIAEVCGWKPSLIANQRAQELRWWNDTRSPMGCPPNCHPETVRDLPDYLNDLNACITLLGDDADIRVRNGMFNVVIYRPSEEWDAHSDNLCGAICEAFLKSRNLWKPDQSGKRDLWPTCV